VIRTLHKHLLCWKFLHLSKIYLDCCSRCIPEWSIKYENCQWCTIGIDL